MTLDQRIDNIKDAVHDLHLVAAERGHATQSESALRVLLQERFIDLWGRRARELSDSLRESDCPDPEYVEAIQDKLREAPTL